MTLPFRRRHHDDDSGHDRARSLWSTAMLEPIAERDQAWLDAHLAGCAECRIEHEASLADRELLRGLRANEPEPPRDLWARTAAAIEHESGRRGRGPVGLPSPDRLFPRRTRAPLGVLSGILVVLVVVAVSVAPRFLQSPLNASPGQGTQAALASPAPSLLAVRTAPIAWVQTSANGSYQVRIADIDEVCPNTRTGCAPIDTSTHSVLTLGSPPDALVGSPNNTQLVIVAGAKGSGAGEIIVVPVASQGPGASATPVQPSATPNSNPSGTPSNAPSSPTGSARPTPVPTPVGAHSIADGVVVVGEARYSADGTWLAFSAAPIDGSTGPDLYVWNGTDPTATAVTSNHGAYFSSWLGDRILASRVSVATAAAPAASAASAAAPPSVAASPDASSGIGGLPVFLEHPTSFLFDPATATSVDLPTPDAWLPVADPFGRLITYWAGTVAVGPGPNHVAPAAGHLVLDVWNDPTVATPRASNGHGPGNTPGGSPHPGPAGAPIELAAAPLSAFQTRFDPTGTRLAVWVANSGDPTIGTLRLIVLDRNGHVDPRLDPLPAVSALKGFSIDQGRLAWVSPPGQNGDQSTVQVLAWSNDNFGSVETLPGDQVTIVR